MTTRRPSPPAPGPLETYAAEFDPVLARLPQRRGFRDYLAGLLAPRDRNKTLTALADAEPIVGAQHREAQRLQYFLSESVWDAEAVNQVRVRLLREDTLTRPHPGGVLVIDDTGDRKDGPAMAHVARQYLGSVGKTDRGIVVVTSLWADEHAYWPVDLAPYTPASRLPRGERDPGFATKPQLALKLIESAQAPGSGFARWWPTAPTATTPTFSRRWRPAGRRGCWRCDPRGGSGRGRRIRTPRGGRPSAGVGWRRPAWSLDRGRAQVP
jgi:SRSO17 transposase